VREGGKYPHNREPLTSLTSLTRARPLWPLPAAGIHLGRGASRPGASRRTVRPRKARSQEWLTSPNNWQEPAAVVRRPAVLAVAAHAEPLRSGGELAAASMVVHAAQAGDQVKRTACSGTASTRAKPENWAGSCARSRARLRCWSPRRCAPMTSSPQSGFGAARMSSERWPRPRPRANSNDRA
jgi:hypothetical protein